MSHLGRCRRIFFGVLVTTLLAAPASATAADYPVTKGSDTRDGACNADCSLREAVDAANINAGADRVLLPARTYELTRDDPTPGSSDNVNEFGDLDPSGPIEFLGDGSASTVIDAKGFDRHIDFFSLGANPGTVAVTGATLRGGVTPFSGGAISVNNYSLNLNDVVLSGNSSPSGGALNIGGNAGLVIATLRGVTLQGNIATNGDGGAIRSDSVTNSLILQNSAVVGNRAQDGGGIESNLGALNLENVTVSGNTATGEGGGIRQTGASATLTHATIAENAAGGAGDGLRAVGSANIETRNSLFANSAADNCALGTFPITSSGNDLDSGASCGFTGLGDRQNAAAKLVPLAANPATLPGSGPTHALYAGSAAINAADPSHCTAQDQRGIARPIGPACDIGAFEAPLNPPAEPVSTPGSTTTGATPAAGGPVRLAIRGLSATNRVFRVDPRGQVAAKRRSKAPKGTRFGFTLNAAARVRLTIERIDRGRRVKGKCRRQTKGNRKRRRCVRYVNRGSFVRQGKLGRNTVPFSGRIRVRGRVRTLTPARYRITLQATDAAGKSSPAVRTTFRVVR